MSEDTYWESVGVTQKKPCQLPWNDKLRPRFDGSITIMQAQREATAMPPKTVMFQLHQDHQLLQARDAIMELMNGRRRQQYNALDPFSNILFGPSPDAELGTIFVDDDDYTDDDSDYEDRRNKKEFCGFPRNFLDHGPTRSRSPHPPHAPYRPGLRQIMHEQAEKNAKELIQEEERIKARAEKKRLKKLRRKERKRKEKEEEEGNAVKNEDKEDQEVDDSIVKPKSSDSESAKNKKSNKTTASDVATAGPAVPLKKTQANSALVRNQPNSCGPSEDEDDESDDEEEGEASDVDSIASELEMLDMNSSFVTKAATIAMRKLEVKAKAESGRSPRKQEAKQQKPTQPNVQRPAAELLQNGVEQQQQQQENAEVACAEDVVKKSMELAVIGNQMGNSGRFEMAVVYFTEAIMHNPKDFRLFGNRSFCYEKMLQYDKALADANVSLAMSPGWIRGLYRRGRALAGLKRYSEAAEALKEVLQNDPSSSDAAQELMRVQIMQLMEMGFSREQSSNALIIHGTVEKALEAFSSIQDEKFGISNPPAVNANQPVEEKWAVAGQKPQLSVNRGPVPQPQPMFNPRPQAISNHAKSVATPELFPLWVGNLVPAVTEKTISNLFSNAGKIHSIRMLPQRRCAFVNYSRKEDCDVAVDKFNGLVLEETMLSVRYPDRIHTHLGASRSAKQATDSTPRVVPNITPMKSQECVYWRNSGCIKKDRCVFLHVPGHRGIDRGKDKLAP